MKYIITKKCQVCGSKKLKKFLNLGKQPLCDDLLKKKNNNILYNLEILTCDRCLTAFQKYNVNEKILFPKNYHYRAANTLDVILGMKSLVKDLEKKFGSLRDKKVLDIGCNDGSLLDIFKKRGARTFGVEPTGAYFEAKKKGHNVLNKYFDTNISKRFKKTKFDVITFTNVFAHIHNFKELIKSLSKVISTETILVIENHYLGEVLRKYQFDTFYHEHPRTYSFTSFYYISKSLGLNISKVSFVKRYNGNIRVMMSNLKKENKTKINKILNKEKKYKNKFKLFQKKINLWKTKKKKYLKEINQIYGPIPAKAFPGRASIILNFLSLDKNTISSTYEKNNSLKNHYFVPGTDIKILPEKKLKKVLKKKQIILNLAWHISGEIKKYLKQKFNFKGRIIDIMSPIEFK